MSVQQGLFFIFFTGVIWMMSMARVDSQITGFKLVYMWPVSFCHTLRNGEYCAPNLPNAFTIHGLWAFDSLGSRNCPLPPIRQRTTDQLDDEALVEELDQIWINHKTEHSTSNNNKFWNYQWDKHSWCLGLGTRVGYFRNVSRFHNLVSQYIRPYQSLLHLLESSGVTQNSYISNDYVLQKILEHTGFVTELRCNQFLELWEIVFCISAVQQGSIMNCSIPSPTTFLQSNESSQLTSILFPKSPPPPHQLSKSTLSTLNQDSSKSMSPLSNIKSTLSQIITPARLDLWLEFALFHIFFYILRMLRNSLYSLRTSILKKGKILLKAANIELTLRINPKPDSISDESEDSVPRSRYTRGDSDNLSVPRAPSIRHNSGLRWTRADSVPNLATEILERDVQRGRRNSSQPELGNISDDSEDSVPRSRYTRTGSDNLSVPIAPSIRDDTDITQDSEIPSTVRSRRRVRKHFNLES